MNTRQITECKFAMLLPLSHTPWIFDYRYGMGEGSLLMSCAERDTDGGR